MSAERRLHLLFYDSALKIYLAVPCDFGIDSEWDCRMMIRKETVVERIVHWVDEENVEETVVLYPPSLAVDSLLEEGGASRSDSPSVVSYPLSLVVDSLVLRYPSEEEGVFHLDYPSIFGHHPFVGVDSLVPRSLLEEGGVSRSESPSVRGRNHWNFWKRLILDGRWGFRSTAS
jgi:hypothetical protein